MALNFYGLTTRQHAAISLRVPEAEEGWLNDMIRQARRMDYIQGAMQGSMFQNQDAENIAKYAIQTADACLKLEEEQNRDEYIAKRLQEIESKNKRPTEGQAQEGK